MNILTIENLNVYYGLHTAVSKLSLKIDKGESLGLLGVNGAGKTSTIRAILGMLKVKGGKVSLFGKRSIGPDAFAHIGFAPEDGQPPEFLKGKEYLNFVGAFKISNAAQRKKEIENLLHFFDLDPSKKIGHYSKGMKRRLILAQALFGTPDFIILDEPLNGLDPLLIIRLRAKLMDFKKSGGTLLFSSHILAEIEKTCSQIAILHDGKLLYFETVENTLAEHGTVEGAFARLVGPSV